VRSNMVKHGQRLTFLQVQEVQYKAARLGDQSHLSCKLRSATCQLADVLLSCEPATVSDTPLAACACSNHHHFAGTSIWYMRHKSSSK
jgi:hypothetical protein